MKRKKLILFLLVLVLACSLALVACNGESNVETPDNPDTPDVPEVPTITWSEWEVVTLPTVDSTGLIKRTNSKGEEEKFDLPVLSKENYTIEKLGMPTCEETGLVRCHVKVGEDDFSFIVVVPATGHAWAEPIYVWAEDGSKVTAIRPCENDALHNLSVEGVITSAVTLEPTCTVMGETTYTATFDADWASEQTLVLKNIQVIPHTPVDAFEEATFEKDRVEKTVCSVCGSELSRISVPHTALTFTNLLEKNGSKLPSEILSLLSVSTKNISPKKSASDATSSTSNDIKYEILLFEGYPIASVGNEAFTNAILNDDSENDLYFDGTFFYNSVNHSSIISTIIGSQYKAEDGIVYANDRKDIIVKFPENTDIIIPKETAFITEDALDNINVTSMQVEQGNEKYEMIANGIALASKMDPEYNNVYIDVIIASGELGDKNDGRDYHINAIQSNVDYIISSCLGVIENLVYNESCRGVEVYSKLDISDEYTNSQIDYLTRNRFYQYSETDPNKGVVNNKIFNYWHYGEDGVTPVKWNTVIAFDDSEPQNVLLNIEGQDKLAIKKSSNFDAMSFEITQPAVKAVAEPLYDVAPTEWTLDTFRTLFSKMNTLDSMKLTINELGYIGNSHQEVALKSASMYDSEIAYIGRNFNFYNNEELNITKDNISFTLSDGKIVAYRMNPAVLKGEFYNLMLDYISIGNNHHYEAGPQVATKEYINFLDILMSEPDRVEGNLYIYNDGPYSYMIINEGNGSYTFINAENDEYTFDIDQERVRINYTDKYGDSSEIFIEDFNGYVDFSALGNGNMSINYNNILLNIYVNNEAGYEIGYIDSEIGFYPTTDEIYKLIGEDNILSIKDRDTGEAVNLDEYVLNPFSKSLDVTLADVVGVIATIEEGYKVIVNTPFDESKLTVKIEYSNGIIKELTKDEYKIDGIIDTGTLGVSNVNIVYETDYYCNFGYTIIEVIDTYEPIPRVEPTCVLDGHKAHYKGATGVLYMKDDNGYYYKVSKQDVVISKLGHEKGAINSEKAATCTEDGYIDYKCTRCNEIIHEVIKAKGHDWGEVTTEWNTDHTTCTAKRVCQNDSNHVETATTKDISVTVVDATCYEAKKITYTATFAEQWAAVVENKTEVTEGEPLPHDIVLVQRVEPTVENYGMKEHYKCNRCGALFLDAEGLQTTTEQELIISKKLKYEPVDAVAATCESAGVKAHYVGAEDGKKYLLQDGKYIETSDADLVLPALGHDWNAEIEYTVDEATNTITATRTCKRDPKHSETIEGSIYNTFHQTEPTCSKKGTYIYYADFGQNVPAWHKRYYTYELTLPELPHTLETTIDSTNHKQICTVCNQTIIPTTAHEFDENGVCKVCGYKDFGFDFVAIYGGYEITDYHGADKTNLVLPKEYNGVPFISIKTTAIDAVKDTIKVIDITSGFKGISTETLNNITNIEKVVFKDANQLLAMNFAGNPYEKHPLLKLYIGETLVEDLVVPASVTKISRYSLYGYPLLRDVTFEADSKLTEIDMCAFGKSSLRSIALPDGLRTIGSSAFESCANLASIVIPNTVTSMGGSMFQYCNNLTSITFSNAANISSMACYNCKKLSTVVIPEGVTEIGSSAFSSCAALTSVILPDSLKNISSNAFRSTGLVTIDLKNVETLGDEVFATCDSMTYIVLPETVKTVGKEICATGYHTAHVQVKIFVKATSKPAGYNDEFNGGYYEADDSPANQPTYYYSDTNKKGCWHYVGSTPTLW